MDLQDLTAEARSLIEGDIFQLPAIQGASEEKKEEMLGALLESVQARVFLRIDDLIKGQESGAWQQVLETGDEEAIRIFLQQSEIDINQLVVEESLLVKQEVMDKLSGITTHKAGK